MLRHCLISLIAIGPLALLQLVAWLGMALQADLSSARTGNDILLAVSAEFSTPCQLCESVQATQTDNEDNSALNDRRIELATRADKQLLQLTASVTETFSATNTQSWIQRFNEGPKPPPPRDQTAA